MTVLRLAAALAVVIAISLLWAGLGDSHRQNADLSSAAYKGQAPKLQSSAVLAAAVGIHSVEARHAAWMRELFGITPAVNAFDKPAPKQRINRIVASTHFIVARPKMKARSKPKYTG